MVKELSESLNIPCEGIFWYINNELVYLCDTVDPKDPFSFTDLLHKDSWKKLKSKYKVNGKEVPFDYFPRGRVETLVISDSKGNLDHYESNIYLDRCINKKYVIDKIIDAFRLYLPNVKYSVQGQLFIDGSHYTCFNCS